MQIQAFSTYSYGYGSLNNEPTSYKKENTDDKTQKEDVKNSSEVKDETQLSPAEKTKVARLKSIDAEVRAHEMAHVSAGGGLTGAATYSYTKGPDNKMYATSGEVSISMKEGRTPEETISIARQIQAAAMAPSDPSPQDYKVAASAMQMEIKARADMVKQQAEENMQRNEEMNDKNEALRKDSDELSVEDKQRIGRAYSYNNPFDSSFDLAV